MSYFSIVSRDSESDGSNDTQKQQSLVVVVPFYDAEIYLYPRPPPPLVFLFFSPIADTWIHHFVCVSSPLWLMNHEAMLSTARSINCLFAFSPPPLPGYWICPYFAVDFVGREIEYARTQSRAATTTTRKCDERREKDNCWCCATTSVSRISLKKEEEEDTPPFFSRQFLFLTQSTRPSWLWSWTPMPKEIYLLFLYFVYDYATCEGRKEGMKADAPSEEEETVGILLRVCIYKDSDVQDQVFPINITEKRRRRWRDLMVPKGLFIVPLLQCLRWTAFLSLLK